MSTTTHYNLVLTGSDATSMTFQQWRTLMNGTGSDSNMQLIDAAMYDIENKVDSIVDDTAGCGDTKVAWSANKTYNNLVNIITILGGTDDLLHATIMEGKYANYYWGTIETLSGCNVAEFYVDAIVKFTYAYTNNSPDLRGLFFVDSNGTPLDTSYQAIETAQEITVPVGAVKCYASVSSIDDIVISDVVSIMGEEILKDQATYEDSIQWSSSGQIEYKWSEDHSTIHIEGDLNSYNKMAGATNALPDGIVPGGRYRFVFNAEDPNIALQCLVYDSSTLYEQKLFNRPQVWTIPDNATGVEIRVGVGGSGDEVNETVACPEIYALPQVRSFAERVTNLENAAYGNDDNPLAYIHKEAGLLSIFHTVGVIGDSLASGEAVYKLNGQNGYIDLYEFSWGQCLARLTGGTYYNFSEGGMSSRSWLSAEAGSGFGPNGIHAFDGQHDCVAYFIGLGQNDKNNSIPVGSTSDINLSDYTQNADTYCGNMGKIIQKIRALQPKSHIFVFTDPNPPSNDQSYNAVIPGIVALFNNVWIIDLKAYAEWMFKDSSQIIGSQNRVGHYSAVGYQEIAYVIATYVDWIIKHNLSAFSQVEFIGTNYEWTT